MNFVIKNSNTRCTSKEHIFLQSSFMFSYILVFIFLAMSPSFIQIDCCYIFYKIPLFNHKNALKDFYCRFDSNLYVNLWLKMKYYCFYFLECSKIIFNLD